MAIQPKRHRFTTTDYYRMGEAGVFGHDARVELIDGEIIDMSPIGPRHSDGVDRFNELFVTRFAGVARVRIQNPIHLSEHNDPQPDVVLARRRAGGYGARHPEPGDVLLVVEVADSSIEFDRQVKAGMYARAGIPELWIWDLGRELILVHCDPTPDGYATIRVARRCESLSPLAVPDVVLPVSDLLG